MSKKVKFTLEDEEKIIEFVKSNEILYNVKHKRFRNAESKNRLWLKLANDLNVDVEVVKNKWTTMRDYFNRNKGKKTTVSEASISKRDESLSFLLQTSILSRPTISSVPTTAESRQSTTAGSTQSSTSAFAMISPIEDDLLDEAHMRQTMANLDSVSNTGSAFSRDGSPFSDVSSSKKRKVQSETNDLLREFLAARPKPSDFLLQKPADDVQQFFDSMASTVCKFTPLSIARIKLKIAQIVGEEEIAWAEQNEKHLSKTFSLFLEQKQKRN